MALAGLMLAAGGAPSSHRSLGAGGATRDTAVEVATSLALAGRDRAWACCGLTHVMPSAAEPVTDEPSPPRSWFPARLSMVRRDHASPPLHRRFCRFP